MESEMDSWNDERLDELSGRMDEGFVKVDQRFDRIDQRFDKIDQRFDKIDQRFERVATKEEMGEVKGELRHLNERFDRLLHALMVGGLSFGIAIFATVGGLLVALV